MSQPAGCPFHKTEAQERLSAEFDAFTLLRDPHPFLQQAREQAPRSLWLQT